MRSCGRPRSGEEGADGVADAVQVVGSEIGVEGQGDGVPGRRFGVGELALSVAQVRQRGLVGQRYRVVDLGADAV